MPLAANFSTGEIVAIAGVDLIAAVLVAAEKPLAKLTIGDPTVATCPRCAFGPPGQKDKEISELLWGGPGASSFLGGVPDRMGYILPAGALAYYMTNGLVAVGRSDKRGLTGSFDADHEMLAFLEAIGLSLGVTTTVKLSTGRLRPYYELDRPSQLRAPPDSNLSFFSGHASTSFCIASFIYRDVSDDLFARRLADEDMFARVMLGRVFPFIGIYGVASVIGLSRIVDQAHYASDVGLGALVGAAVGNAAYALHFDGSGKPRRWHELRVVPHPGGVGVSGRF